DGYRIVQGDVDRPGGDREGTQRQADGEHEDGRAGRRCESHEVFSSHSVQRVPLVASNRCAASAGQVTVTRAPSGRSTRPGARTASVCGPTAQLTMESAPRYSTATKRA